MMKDHFYQIPNTKQQNARNLNCFKVPIEKMTAKDRMQAH